MYDVIIIGAGFAGFSAATYAARYNLKTLIIAKELGGAIVSSNEVCNYPGFSKISGLELMKKFEEQAKSVGAEITNEEVIEAVKENIGFRVITDKKKEYKTKTIILAQGSERRRLDVSGAKEFEGKGIHYCATCDAAFYKDKTVAVVGGGNSAAYASLLLSKFARKVYIIYRKVQDLRFIL